MKCESGISVYIYRYKSSRFEKPPCRTTPRKKYFGLWLAAHAAGSRCSERQSPLKKRPFCAPRLRSAPKPRLRQPAFDCPCRNPAPLTFRRRADRSAHCPVFRAQAPTIPTCFPLPCRKPAPLTFRRRSDRSAHCPVFRAQAPAAPTCFPLPLPKSGAFDIPRTKPPLHRAPI